MITLVLGGTRSGKSAFAERLASAAEATVTYVATARVAPDDPAHAARVEAHRVRRPVDWHTIECPDAGTLPQVLRDVAGTVLLDSIGTWVSGHPDLDADPTELVDALVARRGDTIVVSEEVGLALHAPTEAGRRFTDTVGIVNQAISAVAERAVLVVAGRALELPPPTC
ncbi:bifunctional adenosylcobinamide kinase/adenosylcobinamide-phosphate guanylyltransferase [Actinospongicola halichondriae]|uniref:bifunctional adenosylcobinamide kinase/adenosylcobinamide-phosphate guanylyltransferase n=1 Tax=Actinospongicola halichondriae TaxID=3236844 RepID=UPI003D435EA6